MSTETTDVVYYVHCLKVMQLCNFAEQQLLRLQVTLIE